jgi:hypothetical protein
MYIYKCVFTGKKVFSDAYPHTLENGIVWIVEGNYEELDGSHEELSDQKSDEELFEDSNCVYVPVVNNLVRDFCLEEPVTITSLDNFKKALKKYMVNLFAKLNEVNPDRVNAIKSTIPIYSKAWAENFDRIRVYVTEGDGFEVEGTLIILTQDIPFGEEKPNDKCRITVLADSLVKEEF